MKYYTIWRNRKAGIEAATIDEFKSVSVRLRDGKWLGRNGVLDEALYLGSRIIVMDGASGRICSDEPNPLYGRRRNVSELRGHRDYGAARERLLGLLGEGAIPARPRPAAQLNRQ